MSDPGDEEPWRPTGRQVARAERSRGMLRARRVPMYRGPLYVDDDEEVALRSGPEVAGRMLSLWVVVLRAEGMPRLEAWDLIDRLVLREALSPQEEGFLADAEPDPDTSRAYTGAWRPSGCCSGRWGGSRSWAGRSGCATCPTSSNW
nr:DUF4272 domain-containing protein [Tautonia plasticadhaerens]